MLFKVAFICFFVAAASACKSKTCNYRTVHTPNTLMKCYMPIMYFKANFIQATNFCNLMGMELATVESPRENTDLFALLTSDCGSKIEPFWISATDLANEGDFVWMSNGLPVVYNNFAKGQPDNAMAGEDCVAMSTKQPQWFDTNCQNKQYFVCQTTKDCKNCK